MIFIFFLNKIFVGISAKIVTLLCMNGSNRVSSTARQCERECGIVKTFKIILCTYYLNIHVVHKESKHEAVYLHYYLHTKNKMYNLLKIFSQMQIILNFIFLAHKIHVFNGIYRLFSMWSLWRLDLE